MKFEFTICGTGFAMEIGTVDYQRQCRIILSWAIFRKHAIWRGEQNYISRDGYHYSCVKNGQTVESFTLRSPVVHHE